VLARRATPALVIADVKRGDIGSTVDAYGEAWLRPGRASRPTRMTISAYQGLGSIEQVMVAEAAGKGLFVLAATSQPEAARSSAPSCAVEPRRQHGRAGDHAGVIGWNQGERMPRARPRLDRRRVRRHHRPELAGIDTTRRAAPGLPVLAPDSGTRGGARRHPAALRRLWRRRRRERVAIAAHGRARGLADAIARRADEYGAAIA
jgi:orotidine-5'-phosphate decarboxylase